LRVYLFWLAAVTTSAIRSRTRRTVRAVGRTIRPAIDATDRVDLASASEEPAGARLVEARASAVHLAEPAEARRAERREVRKATRRSKVPRVPAERVTARRPVSVAGREAAAVPEAAA
jgi:hypothetical protein